MMIIPVVLGFVLGFAGSIPPAGPAGAMLLKLGFSRQFHSARYTAAGCALGEGIYGGVGYFSVGLAARAVSMPRWVQLGAQGLTCIILWILGGLFITMNTAAPKKEDNKSAAKNAALSFAAGATLALLNPALIITYGSAVSAAAALLPLEFEATTALTFAVGVSAGVGAWYTILIGLLQTHGSRMFPYLPTITTSMGLLFIGAGCLALTNLLVALGHHARLHNSAGS